MLTRLADSKSDTTSYWRYVHIRPDYHYSTHRKMNMSIAASYGRCRVTIYQTEPSRLIQRWKVSLPMFFADFRSDAQFV